MSSHIIDALNGALNYLTNFKQFVAWKAIPLPDGKTKKLLINPHTAGNASSTNPVTWGTHTEVLQFCETHPDHFVGFVLSENDDIFFLDVDNARDTETGVWNDISVELQHLFAHAFCEVSQSGNGLHIIGRGSKPDGYKAKSKIHDFDVYTTGRFIALTGNATPNTGSVETYDHTVGLTDIVTRYIPINETKDIEWSEGACAEYRSDKTDEELIQLALKAGNDIQRTFGGGAGKALFKDIWNRDTDVLLKHYPCDQGAGIDESALESALCTHLAFWTGKHSARIESIVSNLYPHVRDKWVNRDTYRRDTIIKACALVKDVYSAMDKKLTAFIEQTVTPPTPPVTTATATSFPAPNWVNGITPGGDYSKDHTVSAITFLRDYYHNGSYLMRVEQDFYRFNGVVWDKVDDDTIRAELTNAMLAESPQSGWIDGTMKLICNITHRKATDFNSWPGRDTSNLIVYTNGILDAKLNTFEPHNPAYLTTNVMPYAYDAASTCPRWESFLLEIFEGDTERVALLQEWLGYCLVRDYSFHKAMLLIGLKRSGKGTIGRVLKMLVGEQNFAGIGLEELADDEALNSMRTKTVAFDGDANSYVSKNNEGVIVTRFKKISGGDEVFFKRKYKSSIGAYIPTRLTIAANNMPAFIDDSGAMSSRLLVLPLNLSFYGREDLNLTPKLQAEISGVANWSLRGLSRLRANGRFTEPTISVDEMAQIEETYSPLLAFVSECLVKGPGQQITGVQLYQVYSMWCKRNGRKVGTQQSLTRQIKDTLRGEIQHGNVTMPGTKPAKGFKGLGVVPVVGVA